jgi:hypothetical protein
LIMRRGGGLAPVRDHSGSRYVRVLCGAASKADGLNTTSNGHPTAESGLFRYPDPALCHAAGALIPENCLKLVGIRGLQKDGIDAMQKRMASDSGQSIWQCPNPAMTGRPSPQLKPTGRRIRVRLLGQAQVHQIRLTREPHPELQSRNE